MSLVEGGDGVAGVIENLTAIFEVEGEEIVILSIIFHILKFITLQNWKYISYPSDKEVESRLFPSSWSP